MSIQLYNSLTRETESFVPREGKRVQMFVCGPTVYDFIHLGNARTFTIFDVVAKWLRYRGYDLTYIQNITDIDDRIIKRAAEQNQDPLDYARHFEEIFLQDMQAIGNTAVSQYARATDHIPQVIAQVKTLIEREHVYLIPGDGWYFDLSTFPDYGKLSGRTSLGAQDAVSRIDDSDKKRNPGDFCVWKLKKESSEPSWPDAELGEGRPGWHIEDTAITEQYFGPQYDVHGGGIDLKFPHHEAEIAQQESASGKVPFVKYWMHAGFLENKSEKMSKSLGNFRTLHDARETTDSAALRFYLLSAHYRAPLEYSEEQIASAEATHQRIRDLRDKAALETKNIPTPSPLTDAAESALIEAGTAMDNDFNTPKAFAALFDFITTANTRFDEGGFDETDVAAILKVLTFFEDQFGIIPTDTDSIPAEVTALALEREGARKNKDWVAADAAREAIESLGYTVDDTPAGPLVKKK